MRKLIFALVLGTVLLSPHSALAAKKFSYYHQSTGMKLTISKLELDPKGDSLASPGRGKTFQMAYVTIANLGSHTGSYNPLDISLTDDHGKSYKSTTFLPAYYHQLGCCKLAGHSHHTGCVGW